MSKYILEGKKAILCEDLIKWANWLESAERKVAETNKGNVQISTVFLGLDHRFGEGEPILFETMVFGGKHDGFCQRYPTWEEAEKGHNELVNEYFGI